MKGRRSKQHRMASTQAEAWILLQQRILVFLITRPRFLRRVQFGDIATWGMYGTIPALVRVQINRRTATHTHTEPYSHTHGARSPTRCTNKDSKAVAMPVPRSRELECADYTGMPLRTSQRHVSTARQYDVPSKLSEATYTNAATILRSYALSLVLTSAPYMYPVVPLESLAQDRYHSTERLTDIP